MLCDLEKYVTSLIMLRVIWLTFFMQCLFSTIITIFLFLKVKCDIFANVHINK